MGGGGGALYVLSAQWAVCNVTCVYLHDVLEMIYEKLQEIGNVQGILRIMDTAGSVRNIR